MVGCSSSNKPKNEDIIYDGYLYMSDQDYAKQMFTLKEAFLKQPEIKIIKQSDKMKSYFSRLSKNIIGRNEILFRVLSGANITILDNQTPLHFSLPGGEIFLSKGLLTKYIKHESVLVSVLSYELIKSEKNLYPKESFVPTGVISLEKLVGLNRLPFEEKIEMHKWAYYMTTRTGHDGEYYLSWLQTLNRNTADFVYLVGDVSIIPREESLFKAFLIKNSNDEAVISQKSSSKEFYQIINQLRD